MEVRRPGRASADMHLDIERGAKLTIRETDDRGLRLVRWEPFSADQALGLLSLNVARTAREPACAG
jgi:hypothetical protein